MRESDRKRFAIKLVSEERAADDTNNINYAHACAEREIQLLRRLPPHPAIVTFEEDFLAAGVVHIVMEKMSCNLRQV